MSNTTDQMPLKEESLREKYSAAESFLDGFDHTPRLAKKADTKAKSGRSSGIGTRRRFRSTTPGLVTKSTARPEGVHIGNRVTTSTEDDPLVSPLQASVLHGLRRALATAML
ncbi:MAG: AAA family ATPase, partial [Robiginitomaculum sp.]|nr:AAA family ATPase [Robiginitomaculum sp.]